MRSWFSLIGLVLVVAVVGLMASRQLSGLRTAPAQAGTPGHRAAPTAASAAAASMQRPAQYQQALEAALQTARPMEGDAR